MDLNQVTLPVTNLQASVTFYKQMGFRQIVDSPHYSRFECPDGDATFSLHVVDELSGRAQITVYFEHEELDALCEELAGRGFRFEQTPEDKSWLWREAILVDPCGNRICLYRAGENRKYPPWRISR
jgi:catechol 2,3-dioxygenase-like lactoylglutathione lyase family enzyme